MVCTFGKSAPKRLKFQKPVPFPPWESADSNFHTNIYGARKSHNITAKCAQILSCAFPPTAHVSRLFLTIYTKLAYFSYTLLGCFWAVSRHFTDTKCWISLCLLIVKVYIEASKYMNVYVCCLAIFWSGMFPVPL